MTAKIYGFDFVVFIVLYCTKSTVPVLLNKNLLTRMLIFKMHFPSSSFRILYDLQCHPDSGDAF